MSVGNRTVVIETEDQLILLLMPPLERWPLLVTAEQSADFENTPKTFLFLHFLHPFLSSDSIFFFTMFHIHSSNLSFFKGFLLFFLLMNSASAILNHRIADHRIAYLLICILFYLRIGACSCMHAQVNRKLCLRFACIDNVKCIF